MKRILVFVCLAALMLCAIAEAEPKAESIMRYQYTHQVNACLGISNNVASCGGDVTPNNGEKTSIVVRLQKNVGGTWITQTTWMASNPGGKSAARGSTSVTSGYQYRTFVTAKVYDGSGNVVESVDKYSSTKSN